VSYGTMRSLSALEAILFMISEDSTGKTDEALI